jgi:hypothetical protein
MSTASLPDRISVLAQVSGHRLAGAFFEIELPMTRKNSFRILLGPAGDDGASSITRAEMHAKAREEVDLFPMDYVGLEAAWTGEVIARAINRPAIRRLRAAHETWGEMGGYPEGFLQHLDDLDARLASNDPADPIQVSFEAEPTDARVRIDSRAVGD